MLLFKRNCVKVMHQGRTYLQNYVICFKIIYTNKKRANASELKQVHH